VGLVVWIFRHYNYCRNNRYVVNHQSSITIQGLLVDDYISSKNKVVTEERYEIIELGIGDNLIASAVCGIICILE
jgi:hypothetical protein